MKNTFYILLISLFANVSFAQKKQYNIQKGYIAKGYDVVAYFDNKAVVGETEHELTYDGVRFKFSTAQNKAKFNVNPSKYMPQYGGWCAYTLAKNNTKAKINPKSFEVRGGKLYLFHRTIFTNNLEKWTDENALVMIRNADQNWNNQTKIIR